MTTTQYAEIPITTANLVQIPEKPPASLSEAIWFFIIPTSVTLVSLAVKELISNLSESAKTEREAEAEEEKQERIEREVLIKNLIEERQLLLKEVCSTKHELACQSCSYFVKGSKNEAT